MNKTALHYMDQRRTPYPSMSLTFGARKTQPKTPIAAGSARLVIVDLSSSPKKFWQGLPRRPEKKVMGTITSTTPWKQLLLSALESNSHLKHSSFFQFATTGSNGRPSNRSVVFRRFEENSDNIEINTDRRTRKIEDLKHCPFAEICWYFTDSWEQFRINGRIDVIDGSNPDPAKLQQREKSWFASSVKSRLQYMGPNPGLPSPIDQSPHEFHIDPSSGPVATFCLLVLDPDQVDYLNLKSNQRIMFTCKENANGEKCWNSETINP